MEKPFFSKSEQTFVTCPIEAWGRLRKHLSQVKSYKSRKLHTRAQYNALKRYIYDLELKIKELEKLTEIHFLKEEESNTLPEHCLPCEYTIKQVSNGKEE